MVHRLQEHAFQPYANLLVYLKKIKNKLWLANHNEPEIAVIPMSTLSLSLSFHMKEFTLFFFSL